MDEKGIRGVVGMTKGDADKQVEAAIDADRRAKNCMVDVQNALKKWNCQIEPILTLTSRGVQGAWAVEPLMIQRVQ
jgi:hypothetical protein